MCTTQEGIETDSSIYDKACSTSSSRSEYWLEFEPMLLELADGIVGGIENSEITGNDCGKFATCLAEGLPLHFVVGQE